MFSFVARYLKRWQQKRAQAPFRKVARESERLAPALKLLPQAQLDDAIGAVKAAVHSDGLAKHKAKALALACEAATRALGKTPYATQVLAAVGLHAGVLVEMGTGEGKTLVAPLAAFLAHLEGLPVHIHTANDYLAMRDASAMLPLYTMLGLSVGVVVDGGATRHKQEVYSCAVVYGHHQAFALDYMRDRLALGIQQVVQPALGYAIVDEADAVLIDEARTPLTISDFHESEVAVYKVAADIAATLVKGESAGLHDFWVDGKDRVALFTDAGYDKVDAALVAAGLLPQDESGAYGTGHQALLAKVQMALAAQHLLLKDYHYVVIAGELVLIDALTGRLLPGRRWDAGLQQALEWKEGLPLSPESTPRATITLQNFFREYRRLSGMTGTATQEAEEFGHVYGLGVMQVPAHRPSIRIDRPAQVFRTQAAKLRQVGDEVLARHATGQPVLVGTASVEQSEQLAELLRAKQLPLEVLNAKEHAREAEIMACAGKLGAITITTSMAGRGVDIQLGGSVGVELYRYVTSIGAQAWEALTPEEQVAARTRIEADIAENAAKVRQAGGLFVLGLERYDSRRQDSQLRGRAARQGDPGETCCYVSLEDPMVENFSGEYLRGVLSVMDIKAGSDLEASVVTKAIDGAQRQVEARSVSARKMLLQFDDVLNSQRKAFYAKRQGLLEDPQALGLFQAEARQYLTEHCERLAPQSVLARNWNVAELSRWMQALGLPTAEPASWPTDAEDFEDYVLAQFDLKLRQVLAPGAAELPAYQQTHLARMALLYGMDTAWAQHLDALDSLRQGIYLRAHAKVDPLQAYKKDAYGLFAAMLDHAAELAISALLAVAENPVPAIPIEA